MEPCWKSGDIKISLGLPYSFNHQSPAIHRVYFNALDIELTGQLNTICRRIWIHGDGLFAELWNRINDIE